MSIKSKILAFTAITALSITSICVAFSNESENITHNPSNDVYVNFSEVRLTENELIQQADLIVQGKINKLIKTDIQHIKADKIKGTAGAKLPYCIYNLDVTDVIDGKSPKNVRVIFSGSLLPKEIKLNKEYVFFLQEELNSDHKGNYHLLSYSQGVYTIDGDSLNGNVDKSIKYRKNVHIEMEPTRIHPPL